MEITLLTDEQIDQLMDRLRERAAERVKIATHRLLGAQGAQSVAERAVYDAKKMLSDERERLRPYLEEWLR